MQRLLAALWLIVGAGSLAAQMEPPIEVRSRVRIRTLDSAGNAIRWMDGTVASRTRDTLVVRPAGGASLIPYFVEPGKELWVRAETARNIRLGAILGGVFGGLTGLIVAVAVGEDCSGAVETCFSSEQISVLGTSLGILGGMAGGGLVGRYLMKPRWVRSDRFSTLAPSIALGRRGIGLEVSLRF